MFVNCNNFEEDKCYRKWMEFRQSRNAAIVRRDAGCCWPRSLLRSTRPPPPCRSGSATWSPIRKPTVTRRSLWAFCWLCSTSYWRYDASQKSNDYQTSSQNYLLLLQLLGLYGQCKSLLKTVRIVLKSEVSLNPLMKFWFNQMKYCKGFCFCFLIDW